MIFDVLAAKLAIGPPEVRAVLNGPDGPDLRGIVYALAGAEAPVVEIVADGTPIGEARMRRSRDARSLGAAPHEDAFTFAHRIPDALYDGAMHLLAARVAGRPEAFGAQGVSFVGDPAIARPRRRRSSRDATTTALVKTLATQTAALTRLLEHTDAVAAPEVGVPADLAQRYGAEVGEAARPALRDYIWLGVIDWSFRIQRPQHLAMQLAAAGGRVFYVSIEFGRADALGRFRILYVPAPSVYEVRLKLSGALPEQIYAGFTEHAIAEIGAALDEMIAVLGISRPNVVVQFPSWYPIACGIPGATVVHDCLDLVGGFKETAPEMVELEKRLLRDADLVVVSSEPLRRHVAEHRADAVVIRNAADVDRFAAAQNRPLPHAGRPTIGYFGAISYWYDIAWIEHAARERPGWDFVLIGSTDGCDVRAVKHMPNVRLLGERPYVELPEHLGGFDVAVIPFQLTELIMCTNPVKLYEYMAAGKPVVASAMPEVAAATELAYVARDARDFVAQIERALAEDSAELRERRRRWASAHTWERRADRMLDALATTRPLVSVVVLAYNNWSFTRACVDSVLRFSDDANFELIVVDNGSTDETAAGLERIARYEPRMRVVSNAQNAGFAAGNNAGIVAATGEYVVLLNNDTYVTRGWMRDLVRPLVLDRSIGLAAPLTNNMGNEQKVAVAYGDMSEMASAALAFQRRHLRERLDVSTVAFFCVATRRDVIARVGLLDERYGLGFFEDDDYCRRVEEAGYRIVIVDDVFVHHHLSASFDALGAERKEEQMKRNRALYEDRWGPWRAHKYRDAPGFG